MNYIDRLQRENAEMRAQLDAVREAINEARAYIGSSKFADWRYVSTMDMEVRLSEAAMVAVR